MAAAISETEVLIPRKKPWWVPIVGALLFLSWLMPLTAVFWDAVDEKVFFVLNGMLAKNSAVDYFWAFANLRYFDVIMAAGYAVLCFLYMFSHRGERLTRRTSELVALTIGLFVMRYVIARTMDFTDYSRRSPTLMLQPAHMLSDLVPSLDAKDSSRSSFPGDHALVSVWVLLFFVTHASRKYYSWAGILTVIAISPRLVGGAHWFTDVMIGSVAVALVVYGFFWGTGLLNWLADRISIPVGKCEQFLRKRLPLPLKRGGYGGS